MKNLAALINELETCIPHHGSKNEAVSASPVGWHIGHSLLTINQIIQQLKKSDPKAYAWSFNIPRLVVLNLKKIPRGRAKAPESVQPKMIQEEAELKNHIAATKQNLANLDGLQKYNYFTHPFFGKITTKQTINFLEIHTNHHLKIITEIIRASK